MGIPHVDADKDPKGVVMNDGIDGLLENVGKESEARSQALQRLWSAGDAAAVFGQPVSSGDYTVIPVAEVAAGGGFGSGMGFNSLRRRRGEAKTESSEGAAGVVEGAEAPSPTMEGAGGGGGGGGGAMARPVAVIVLGPDGVRVQPVLDMTKLALTALGAFGAAAALSMRLVTKRRSR
jgi:uncharacterized spore protein YtfJ